MLNRSPVGRSALACRRRDDLRRAEVARLVGDIPTARAELDRLLADAPAIDDATAFAWAPVLLARADIAAASGDHHAALAAFRRHRELVLTHLGEAHHLAAAAHYNVGKAEVASGLNDDGRASLGRAEEIWTNGHGPDHPDLALVHVALQELEMREGSLAVAREHAESALRIRRAALPEDHVDVGLAWLGLGAAALLQGDAEAAARADAAALAVHERALGSHHPQTALVRANLAEARLAGGATASARANAAQAVADLEPIADLDPSVLAFAWRVHGSALLAAGESTEAVVALRRADALTTGDEPLEHGIVLVELLRAVSQSEPESPTIDDIATRARVVLARAQGEQADAWIRRLDHAHTSKPQEQP
jgi:serine/threonine-protein kinase